MSARLRPFPDLDRYGERFAERILAESERPGFHNTQRKAHYLAKRFAAKEAAAKAMGTGFRNGLAFHHIAVDHEPAGRPVLAFSGQAAAFMQANAIRASHLSLSDEEDRLPSVGCVRAATHHKFMGEWREDRHTIAGISL